MVLEFSVDFSSLTPYHPLNHPHTHRGRESRKRTVGRLECVPLDMPRAIISPVEYRLGEFIRRRAGRRRRGGGCTAMLGTRLQSRTVAGRLATGTDQPFDLPSSRRFLLPATD